MKKFMNEILISELIITGLNFVNRTFFNSRAIFLKLVQVGIFVDLQQFNALRSPKLGPTF